MEAEVPGGLEAFLEAGGRRRARLPLREDDLARWELRA